MGVASARVQPQPPSSSQVQRGELQTVIELPSVVISQVCGHKRVTDLLWPSRPDKECALRWKDLQCGCYDFTIWSCAGHQSELGNIPVSLSWSKLTSTNTSSHFFCVHQNCCFFLANRQQKGSVTRVDSTCAHNHDPSYSVTSWPEATVQKTVKKKAKVQRGLAENRTRNLLHPKQESYH